MSNYDMLMITGDIKMVLHSIYSINCS